jgi:hypothetical protein
MEIQEEIEPIVNVPLSVVIAGGLTLVGYVVAESFYRPDEPGLGHNALAVAISLFLIGFFTMINRRKALTQVLALLVAGKRTVSRGHFAHLRNAADRGAGDLLRCAGGGDGAGHSGLPHPRELRVDGCEPVAEAERIGCC